MADLAQVDQFLNEFRLPGFFSNRGAALKVPGLDGELSRVMQTSSP